MAAYVTDGALLGRCSRRAWVYRGELSKALAHDPWSPIAWLRRGWASAYHGEPEFAIRELRTMLQLMPFDPLRHLAFIGIGCAHFAAGRYERAAR